MDAPTSAANAPARAAGAAPTTAPVATEPAVDAVSAPLREFLAWVARRPRLYSDAMEAWQSHCPRYTVWEDALAAELIRVEPNPGRRFGEAAVTLTDRGRAALAAGESARP